MGRARVTVVGGGAIGAAIAYELCRRGAWDVRLYEAATPGRGATGASLGVLMAVASKKPQGDLVTLRQASLRRYETLIPELEALTGATIPYQRAGILCLYDDRKAAGQWQALIPLRQAQGFAPQWLDADALQARFPAVRACGGLLSPDDRAIDPQRLVDGLIRASELLGATCDRDRPVTRLADLVDPAALDDWLVVAAGTGSNALLAPYVRLPEGESLLQPVGGQALRLRSPDLDLAAVVHAESGDGTDVNLVPLGNDEYWLGATVEFDPKELPRAENVTWLRDRARAFLPNIARAEVLQTWAGYRPRPKHQRAPVLGFVPGLPRCLVATGHYRNGILLAPVTAQITADLIERGDSELPWRGFQMQGG